jgi:pyruvate-formate lyase-activating enzyme
MEIKGVLETFTDYKKTSLIILTKTCDFKCEKEGLCDECSCQNSELSKLQNIEVENYKIINLFKNNPYVEAMIFGGLEPFLQFDEIYNIIEMFREFSHNDIIIYTGYYPDEIKEQIRELKKFSNIIIKFGRYVQNSKSKYDDVLGVTLISENQYARKIENLI